MLRRLVPGSRVRAWARIVAERAQQSVADFEVGDHVRVWIAGSTPTYGGIAPIYGVVVDIRDGDLVVAAGDGARLRADPRITEIV